MSSSTLVPLCPAEVIPAHCQHACVTRRDRAHQSWVRQLRICCHSLQPHRTVQGGPWESTGLCSCHSSWAQDRLSLAPSEEEGRGWGRGRLLTQRGITAPSAAWALQWVALSSPESWLTEILPSGMPVLVFPLLVAVPFPPCPALHRSSLRAAVRAGRRLEVPSCFPV